MKKYVLTKTLLYWSDMSTRKTKKEKQKNGHQGSNPGGHHFVALNVSINNTPAFRPDLQENVHYETIHDVIILWS